MKGGTGGKGGVGNYAVACTEIMAVITLSYIQDVGRQSPHYPLFGENDNNVNVCL